MEDTKPKAFVFVLMPFEESLTDVYEVGIKAACKEAGAYCERVDEQIFDESILERVYNQISKADIVIAEMTGLNANVFYETGYAHALNKRVILLTQDTNDIPFDLKHFPHIMYGGKITTLKSELETRLRWCIANPKESLPAAEIDFEFFVNEVPLTDSPQVRVRAENVDEDHMMGFVGYDFALTLSLHSLAKLVVDPKTFSLALIAPDAPIIHWGRLTGVDTIASYARLPDSKEIYNLRFEQPVFPDSWHDFFVPFAIPSFHLPKVQGKTLHMVLRLFTEFGPKDFPFTVVCEGLEKK